MDAIDDGTRRLVASRLVAKREIGEEGKMDLPLLLGEIKREMSIKIEKEESESYDKPLTTNQKFLFLSICI